MAGGEIETTEFSGVPVVSAEPDQMVAWVVEQIGSPQQTGQHVHLLAGHSVVLARKDPEFLEVLRAGGFVIPDGRWLELLTRKDSQPLKQLRGQDLFREVCVQGQQLGLSHYFFASSDAVLGGLRAKLLSRYRDIRISGGEVYPFGILGESDRRDLVKRVLDSGADVMWMGISSPRQDKEAFWLSQATGKTVICVGAALDFEAGAQKSAPRWVQRIGFEWFYRLLREPKRLLHRYTVGSLQFAALAVRQRMSKR